MSEIIQPTPADSASASSRRTSRQETRTTSRNRRPASVITVAIALTLVCAAFTPRVYGATDSKKPGTLLAKMSTKSAISNSSGLSTPALARVELGESLLGVSGKLRVRFVSPSRSMTLPIISQLFGDSALRRVGMYAASTDATNEPFHFITMRPFADKVAGRIGPYKIGFFPSERRAPRSPAYNNPEGFVEVSADNQFTAVSEHFKLSEFLTHDQTQVWPKYLVLREPLVDKLELVIAELGSMGIPVKKLHVMSGFRTPQYNEPGVGAGGRAQDSRHQFGDAADVYVVNGTRDWMSDLNHDGRVDASDARLLASAAERVERAHPELIGGIGVYQATSAHGPFVHIDVRGVRARWGLL